MLQPRWNQARHRLRRPHRARVGRGDGPRHHAPAHAPRRARAQRPLFAGRAHAAHRALTERPLSVANGLDAARLWDAATGQPIGSPMKHTDDVLSAEFSPDGSLVATASDDNTARVWDTHTAACFTHLRLGAPLRAPSSKRSHSVPTAHASPRPRGTARRACGTRAPAHRTGPRTHGTTITSPTLTSTPDGRRIATASARQNRARVGRRERPAAHRTAAPRRARGAGALSPRRPADRREHLRWHRANLGRARFFHPAARVASGARQDHLDLRTPLRFFLRARPHRSLRTNARRALSTAGNDATRALADIATTEVSVRPVPLGIEVWPASFNKAAAARFGMTDDAPSPI